ncbi:MAG: cytochrome c peroxidase [Putridiphycobacter sp.]|nr:cytochrome c peroxidase [Putridiphycobacter sp.]
MKQMLPFLFFIFQFQTYAVDAILATLQKNLIANCLELETSAQEFVETVQSTNSHWEKMEASFFKARLAFKKVELFVTYLDHEFVNDYINGAPLPKIERKVPELTVLNPKGFQIIEEELIGRNRARVLNLSHSLLKRLHELNNRLHVLTLNHRQVFETMRISLIRLASLGITGFDTPSGLNTMAESKVSLEAIKAVSDLYVPMLTRVLRSEIDSIFISASHFFQVNDFEKFDRFQFIKNVVNPLYKMILVAQKALFIEMRDMASKTPHAINYEATNIFANDFLNADYYVNYANSGNKNAKITLGKNLFFDPIISQNNSRACASCHSPAKGFADGLPKSIATDNTGFLKRNAPGLINSVYATSFFWDNRANSPEAQIDHVIFNEGEFNTDYTNIIEKLSQSNEYRLLFAEAFPTINTINRYTIVGSISAYIQSLRSYNSEFDQLIRGEIKSERADTIEKGFNLFTGKAACATCHFIPTFSGLVPPNFTETETEVLGVPNTANKASAVLDEDLGRYANGKPTEKATFYKHSFKTPTIRNIALTTPYMHNGVFKTLPELMAFYNEGGGHGWGIAPENTTLPEDELNLTADEIKQIIVFMQSLTDTTGMTGPPSTLPRIDNNEVLNKRIVGGLY